MGTEDRCRAGLAIFAQAWEEAGKPPSWGCFLAGHDFGGKGSASCTEVGSTRIVSVTALCRTCHEVVQAAERYSLKDVRLLESREMVERDLLAVAKRRMLLQDRTERWKVT